MNLKNTLITAAIALFAGTASAAIAPYSGSVNLITQTRTSAGVAGPVGDTLSGTSAGTLITFAGPSSINYSGFASAGPLSLTREVFTGGIVNIMSGATLLLELTPVVFSAGTAAGNTLDVTVNEDGIVGGVMYANVTGGMLMNAFNTNQVNAAGRGVVGADFQISTQFQANNCSLAAITCREGTAIFSGYVVPEPASLALLGFGLIGAGIARRRLKAA